MASIDAAFEYEKSLLDYAYEAANNHHMKSLLEGLDIVDATHELESAYEFANNHYTKAIKKIMNKFPHWTYAIPVVVAYARFANENEQINHNFVIATEVVE